jgi:hypothetical protein
MGGTNEDTISGLRIHESDGDIHIHDDSKDLKFKLDLEDFKKEVNASFEALKKKDGLCEIFGNNSDTLCFIRRKGKFSMFILDNNSIKQKILNYLKDC